MRRLIEHQVAVRAFGALIYSFNTQPRHFGVGAFLWQLPVCLCGLLTADEGCAVGSQPLKVTYWEVRPTYSAQGGGGNCERGAGRCSAAQSEFDAPRKIFQPKSLIFRLKDFAGMEKVRFSALISCFSASFYCGKEAKTLVGTSPYSGILG